MSNPKPLKFKEIARLIRSKKKFTVKTASERRNVLVAALAINTAVTTRETEDGFQVIYI